MPQSCRSASVANVADPAIGDRTSDVSHVRSVNLVTDLRNPVCRSDCYVALVILWINGAFGAGKTTVAKEVVARLPDARLCDPERIGFVIRQTLWRGVDYQDVELWRRLVRSRVARVGRRGIAVVPMTVVSPEVFDEVTANARVFVLTASRSTLEGRIAGSSVAPEWRTNNLNRCLAAFDMYDLGEPICTDGHTPKQIAQKILERI